MALAIRDLHGQPAAHGPVDGAGPGRQRPCCATPGGRATPDVLRSLTVACSLLDVQRVAVVHHTDCRALGVEDRAMRRRLAGQLGRDPGPVDFLGHRDLVESVLVDVATIRDCATIPRLGGGRAASSTTSRPTT